MIWSPLITFIISRMASVNLIVIVEAVREIITHKGDELNELVVTAVVAVAVALGEYLHSAQHSCNPFTESMDQV
jgi:hypothetical protein